jgi:hypothetical protein
VHGDASHRLERIAQREHRALLHGSVGPDRLLHTDWIAAVSAALALHPGIVREFVSRATGVVSDHRGCGSGPLIALASRWNLVFRCRCL